MAQISVTITGPTTANKGESKTYRVIWKNGSTLALPPSGPYKWTITGGTLTASNDINASITWNTQGVGTIKYELGGYSSQLSVTVNKAEPNDPNASFSVTQNCGSTTIARSSSPSSDVEWYWQTSSSGTSLTIGKDPALNWTSETPLPINIYLRARYKATPNTWSVSSQFAGTITVASAAPAAPASSTDAHILSNGSGAATLTVASVSGANIYRWYSTSSGGAPIATTSTPSYTTAISQDTDYYVSSGIGNCESSGRQKVSAYIYPLAEILVQGGTTASNLGKKVVMYVSYAYDSYQWKKNGIDIAGATSSSYETNEAGVYSVQVSKASSGGVLSSNTITVTLGLSGQALNYIVSNTIQHKGFYTEDDVNNASLKENAQVVQYFDGLGRPIQTVTTQGSPEEHDIIVPTVYDPFGREVVKYLPYVSGSDGHYKNNFIDKSNANYTNIALSPHYSFYQDNTGILPSDPKPYSETKLESSPLSRVVKQGNAGSVWQPDAIDTYSSSDRTVKSIYLFNEVNEVLLWTYSFPTAAYPLGLINAGTRAAPIFYAENQLHKNKTKDENGNEVIEYIDKDGRTILKRVQVVSGALTVNDANYASTYYIYDDFGNLVCVVPPEAMRQITASGSTAYFDQTDAVKNAFLKRWAFRYVFDGRKRMIQKQVPGADAVYMVYDNRDRLVLTQDGNQRTSFLWTFTKYNELNRPIATGIKDTTAAFTPAEMQLGVDSHYAKSWAKYGDTYIGAAVKNVHGYSNFSYPTVTTAKTVDPNRYLTVTYYDSYSFKSYISGDYSYVNEELSETVNGVEYRQPATEFTSVIGQVTGTRARVLDNFIAGGSIAWLSTVNYYDDKYRIVQTVGDNFRGGSDRVTNVYDFIGKVLKSRATHYGLSWANLVGTRRIGNRFDKTSTTNAWGNSSGVSVEKLPANTDGWVEFTAASNSKAIIVSLSTLSGTIYQLYLTSGAQFQINESGSPNLLVPSPAYSAGDVFRIERKSGKIRFYKNKFFLHERAATADALSIVFNIYSTGGVIYNIRSSFGSFNPQMITRRYEYDHAGRLTHTWHQIGSQSEILLSKNEYNELGQLIDKKLHSTNRQATDAKQSVDYRYNIRGWLTSINNAELNDDGITNDDASDYFGMNLAYNEALGTGNEEIKSNLNDVLISSYSFDGNANDDAPNGINGVVTAATLTTDSQGNSNKAYSFGSSSYIEIPNSLTKHSFIQNTGRFTISAFIKIENLNARNVIVGNTATSQGKGFTFMYETYGSGYGDHQLRFMTTLGTNSISFNALGGIRTINDNNWHHVAVVGDGHSVRFFVDGVQDGDATPITIFSTGASSNTTLIGKTRAAGGLFLGMIGSIDEVKILNRPTTQSEIQIFASRGEFNTVRDGRQYNGNISAMKWSVNQGLSDTKEMAYNFTYDPLNRLVSANNLQSAAIGIWTPGKFHEGELTYDLNGNIKTLTRYNETNAMDMLSYTYASGTNTGNQLLKVVDTGDKYKGFMDGTNTDNDYAYDANGNMTADKNKNITAITYNFLNLPTVVTRGQNKVNYIYDATGRKLSQIISFVNTVKQTDYAGEFQYEDDALQFVQHEEGRIVLSTEKQVYSNDGDDLNSVVTENGTSTSRVTQATDPAYIKVLSNGTTARGAIFGGMLAVQPGERYRIRAKGYRVGSNNVYLLARTNMGNILWGTNWLGAQLSTSLAAESWIEEVVTIPVGATQLETGLYWSVATATDYFLVNDFEITKLGKNTTPEYQYNLKDHLGNVRLTFTTKQDIDSSTATLEDENSEEEEGKFLRYDNARIVNHFLFDHTKGSKPTQVEGGAQRLSGQANEVYGLAKSLSVMPGDVINMEVYAKYIDPNESNRTAALNTLIMQIAAGTAPGTTVLDGGSYATSTASFPFPADATRNTSSSNEAGPKAFLRWLVFDRNYTLIPSKSGFRQMSSAAKENGSDVEHELLSGTVTITEPGYIYVFLSNEQGTNPYEVYFDDFKVEHAKLPVVQVEDYYPFGLTFNSYRRENGIFNRIKFQGQEHIDDLNLGWDSFKWRNHQPDIGRFFNIDPLSEKYLYNSPYAFSENKVTTHIELEGLEAYPINTTNPLYTMGEGFRQYFQAVGSLIDKVFVSVSATTTQMIGEAKVNLGIGEASLKTSIEKTTTTTARSNFGEFMQYNSSNKPAAPMFKVSTETETNQVTEGKVTTRAEGVDVQSTITTKINLETGQPTVSTDLTVGKDGNGGYIESETKPNSSKLDFGIKLETPGTTFKIGFKAGVTLYETTNQ